MKKYNNLYYEIISLKNLIFAWRKTRKRKSKKDYVKKFEENLAYNLKILYDELKNQTYTPKPLETFILRDPKTRRISKSVFKDRIVHHALISVIEPIFDRSFIYNSCANRKGKGTLFALKQFEKFQRKVSHNFSKGAFCFKADIKHYFREIDRTILFKIIKRKIKCEKTLNLIKFILDNFYLEKGIPLGNLTSQFFANVYLNELDKFVKHKLEAKYYIRYVDDFVILHPSRFQLQKWKKEIDLFLRKELKLELHPEKSRVIFLLKGIDFVGFRIFYYFKLLRKRNIKNMSRKVKLFLEDWISKKKIDGIFQGWNAYAKWADSFNLRKDIYLKISKISQTQNLIKSFFFC